MSIFKNNTYGRNGKEAGLSRGISKAVMLARDQPQLTIALGLKLPIRIIPYQTQISRP